MSVDVTAGKFEKIAGSAKRTDASAAKIAADAAPNRPLLATCKLSCAAKIFATADVCRPPFAAEPVGLLPSGKVAFARRSPQPSGETHIFFEPVAFARRVTSQVVRPKLPGPNERNTGPLPLLAHPGSWASLLKRAYELDLSTCPACGTAHTPRRAGRAICVERQPQQFSSPEERVGWLLAYRLTMSRSPTSRASRGSKVPVAGVPGSVVKVPRYVSDHALDHLSRCRAKPDVAFRAASSSGRSGCAQQEPRDRRASVSSTSAHIGSMP